MPQSKKYRETMVAAIETLLRAGWDANKIVQVLPTSTATIYRVQREMQSQPIRRAAMTEEFAAFRRAIAEQEI